MKKKIALIGKTLKHSYSKIIHNLMADYLYDLVEVSPDKLQEFAINGGYDGYNVTIPYKKDIMPYLDQIDEFARLIGAVNTVVVKDGKRKGYNTDFRGMTYALARAGISVKDKNVLILGSGGTSNTAQAVTTHLGAKTVNVVSRSGEINYDNCYEQKDSNIIINTTPVGMYPNNYERVIDLSRFPVLEGVFDAIYNPYLTEFLYQAKELGLKYTDGLPMLVAQAKYAMEIFLETTCGEDVIESVLEKIRKQTKNVVLIGMPGSGKTTIGKRLAEILDKEFIDTDCKIVEKDGRDIPSIFSESGEDYFRNLEREVLKEVGKLSGKVIATGGGVVKNKGNYFPLKQNADIVWIKRPLDKLSTDGRPLSKDGKLDKLYQERKDLYLQFSDYSVENTGEIENAVKGVIDIL